MNTAEAVGNAVAMNMKMSAKLLLDGLEEKGEKILLLAKSTNREPRRVRMFVKNKYCNQKSSMLI